MSQPKQKRKEIQDFPYVYEKWISTITKIRRGWGLVIKPHIHQDAEREMAIEDGISRSHKSIGQSMRCWQKQRTNRGIWAGFSNGSSSDRLSDEHEREIAENIMDWWISRKPYTQWYSEKFLQQKLNFDDYE